jgi:alkanesulfonate monooxygenase SsuD/methylene tetrahydromethanopterin reductase-like flavin-dependent oxidoreductase (luciferase family)
LGVGIGGEHPKEWEANQVPVKERTKRTDEIIEILKRVWSEDHVTYNGKYYQFDDVTMDPKPAHKIPIIVGGRSEAATERTAKLGDGWVAIWLSPDKMKQRMALIDKQTTSFGREPSEIEKRFQVYIRIDSSKEAARTAAQKFLSTAYNMAFDPLDKYTAYGTAEDCARYLKPFIALGVDQINFAMIYDPGKPSEMAEKIYNELLPMLSKS